MSEDLLVDHTGDEEIRSIRNLRVSRRRVPEPLPVRPRRTSRWFVVFAWASITLVALFIAAITFFAFQHTKVALTPKAHRVEFQPAISIKALPLGSSTSSLSYATQTIELEDSESVPASGQRSVIRKATGKITVYNEYDTNPVKLIKDTRFESPEGIIFRATENVSVPGKKGTTPGTLVVSVIADKAGPTGNIGPTTKFTLPGLKSNGPMFNGVTGKSDTPMSGGIEGTEPTIDETTLDQAITRLKTSLEGKIQSELAKLSTSSMALIDLAETDYTVTPPAMSGDATAIVKVSATTKVPILSSYDFARSVASQVGFDTGTLPFTITPLSDFSVTHTTGTAELGFDPITFVLKGSALLVPELDPEKIATRLSGRESGELQKIVNELAHIKSATTKIEPFWSDTFPSDVRNIQVQILSPQE